MQIKYIARYGEVFMKTSRLLVKAAMLISISSAALAHGEQHDSHQSAVRSGTIYGVISDSMCKSDHSAMIKSGHGKDAVTCTEACWKEGNKAVLVDKKNNVVYSLTNPKSVTKYAGKTVAVTGHIDDSTKVIHVHSIKGQ
jgi:hypothetical protein